MKKSIFLFFAAILCAMTANAYNQAAKDLYFDNSEAKWNSCYVYIGHGTWTSVYPLTRVSGTQYLWQLPANFNGGNAWNGATGWVVCYEKWWDSKGESIDKYTWHGSKNVTQKSTDAWVDTNIYKTNGTASTKSDNNTIDAYKVTSYTKSNYTVTINTVEGGTLTVKDYDNNAVASGDSKIHLTVLKFSATPTSGYVLDAVEISDGTNTTTIAAADLATKTYTLTSAVTITPVWRATTSTVTVTATATNGTVTGGGVVEEGTSVTLTATADAGYQFKNWTVAGTEVSTANPYIFTANEDVTVTANFEETPKATIYFVNNGEWSKIQAYAWEGTKGANPGWPGADITANKLGEQIGGFDVYSYTVEQGSYGKVIFNNGSAQTQNYVWTDGNYYWNNEAKDFPGGSKADAETKLSVPVEYDYVYFINTNDWAAVKIYTWTPEIGGWPGVAMTKESEQIAGKDVYSYKAVKGTTFGGIKFSDNGGTQTGDLEWQAGKYYAPSKSKWYDTKEAAAEALAAPVVDVYTVVGSDVLLGTAWDLNNADNEMTKQDDGSYVLVKENVDLAKTGTYEYKVVKNHDWAWSVPEGNANLTLKLGNEDVDGTYNVTFTLNKELNALTTSLELVEAKKVIPECYVAGDESLTGQDWNAKSVSMTYDEVTEVYTATLTAVPAGTHNMKVVYGGEWLGFDHLATPAPVNVKEGEDKKIQFTLAEAGDVIVTYHATNGIGLTGNFAAPVTYDYYIAGTLAGGWSATQQGMESIDGVYKHTFTELAAGTYQFKVTNGKWGNEEGGFECIALGATYEGVSIVEGNVQIATEEAKDITVIFDATADEITFEGLTEIEDYYTVVGVAELFGEAWATASETNKMVKQVDGSYKLVKENVTLAAIGYDWKIAKNGDWWNDAAIGVNPSEGNNTLTIDPAGRYNVTFTLAADLTSATVETELLEAAVVIPDCFISGNKNLTGEETEWQGNEFTMVYDEETETWAYTLAGLQPEKEYELKVVCGGTWYSYANLASVPTGVTEGNDHSIAFKMAAAGDVTVTYNVEAGITISGNFYVAPTYDYYIAGNMNGWDKASADYGMTDENADGIYEKEITLAAGQDHQFKVTNGKWGNEEGGFDCATVEGAYEEVDSQDGNVLVKLNAETTFTVIFDATAKKITFEGLTEIVPTELVYNVTVPAGTPNCYIVFGDAWDAENAPAMTKVDDTHYTYTRTGLKSDEYKYLYGQSWDFVEVRADNRTWAEEDVVENWNNPYTEVRTALTAGNYYTICMTKEMKEVKGATLWSFYGKDANFAYLVQEEAPYAAGKAYIMYAEAETVSAILTGDEVLAPVANGAIHGTFAPMDQDALDAAGDNIYLVIGNQLRRVDGQTGNSLPANRAYVDIDEMIEVGAPAGIPANRVRSMPMQPQVATGMENVDASAQPVKTIINGQLYILRGEKMYDAQGKLVK